MSTTRRDFLKRTVIAGAGAAAATRSSQSAALQAEPAIVPQAATAQTEYTRGIGIYPGDPAEDFGPVVVPDTSGAYRNLALLRPAYHSSSYDYNLTAQLVTDGIVDTKRPSWIAVSVNGQGTLPINEREVFVDHFPTNVFELKGGSPEVQIELGGDALPEVDRVAVFVVVTEQMAAASLAFTVSVSDDGRVWKAVGTAQGPTPESPENYPPGLTEHAQLFFPSIPLQQVGRSRFYKVQCSYAGTTADGSDVLWQMGQVEFYHGATRVQVGGPYSFTSAWMSAGSGEEWVYVDLGARSQFDRVALHWIARPAQGVIQASDDAVEWRELLPLPAAQTQVDDLRLPAPAQARYVRVLMSRPTSEDGYILSEFEVYGRGGMTVRAPATPAPRTDGRLGLAGGAWRLQRAELAGGEGESLSKPGFKDDAWIIATVSGTVLTSYFNAGAIPDPNFGKNQLYLSDSFFYSDFWYRTEFNAPATGQDEIAWLNFDGLNWKGDIFLNGEKIGRIEGGFLRGRFDVTGKIRAGQPNALAVRIEKNATPGSAKQKTLESPGKNGGALGADNPTYHSSIGWDWIPTIRGRNVGIWGDVFLTVTGAVTLGNAFVSSTLPLPDTSRADVAIEVDLVNHRAKPVAGLLRGTFGAVAFEQKIALEAGARTTVKLDPGTTPGLRISSPELWWPAGYGEPHLYDLELSFETKHHRVSDKKAMKAGIRQMTYSEDGGRLRMFINGRRFIARGGNWGFSESMLRYRAREYDAAVRYHREMNFTMIRNWVGQIGDEAFYEACDRYGVMVWQDFWLANPSDGPIPNDNAMFLNNAEDLVRRIRSHPSMGIYCGRNEGYPPKPLEQGLRALLGRLHPDLHYIPSSADDVVSGHGPYMALPPTSYFETADRKLHSEIGAPTIPPMESVRAMMPEGAIWPQGLEWGLHDFCLEGAQGGATFREIIKDSYGGADSAEQWVALAQFVNYETYRAMFEAQSRYRMGLLLWMSHPCWPSFVWQTYDYYLEPTSVYFGCKKGSEPLHIQWNRTRDEIEVVNYSGGSRKGLSAKADIVNLDGTHKWTKTFVLDSAEDSTTACFQIEDVAGLTPVHFLRLTLSDGGKVVSTNTYLRALLEGDYRAIRELPQVTVQADTHAERQGDRWMLTTQLSNSSSAPALMVRLKAVRAQTGDRILPAFYSDNYTMLLPGEQQTFTTEVMHADTRGETPRIAVEGFNVKSSS